MPVLWIEWNGIRIRTGHNSEKRRTSEQSATGSKAGTCHRLPFLLSLLLSPLASLLSPLSSMLSLWLLIIITLGMSIINAKTHRKTHFVLSLMASGCTLRLTKGSFDQLHHCSLLSSLCSLPHHFFLLFSFSSLSFSSSLSLNVYYFTTRTSDFANGRSFLPFSSSLFFLFFSHTRETKRK